MKEILLYAATLVCGGLLTYIGESWFGAEWIFGLLTVVLFGLFLQGWSRWGSSGVGLVIVTAFLLLGIDSIFFVQYLPAFVCSLLMGVLLLTLFRRNRDAVGTSIIFVLLNVLIAVVFIPSEVMLWMIVLITGSAALFGFCYNLLLFKGCFVALFSITAFFMLLFEIFDGSIALSMLAIGMVAFFIVTMYRLNGRAIA